MTRPGIDSHTRNVARSLLLAVLLIPAIAADPDARDADPCTLLTTAEVQQAFPGAKAGQPDRALEKKGILRCSWSYPTGRLLLIASDEDESAKEGAEGLALTFLDPLRDDAAGRVRYETLTGVGDQAVAVIEREDKARGFMRDGAILVVRRGKRQVAALSTDLARRDRAEALRVLTQLGQAIARRLSTP